MSVASPEPVLAVARSPVVCAQSGACWRWCCRSCCVSWPKSGCFVGLQRGKAKPPLGVVLVTAPSREAG